MRKACAGAVLALAVLAAVAVAYAPIPESYWGTAKLDGEDAPSGLSVTVKVTGTSEVVGSSVTEEGGGFSLDVVFDNSGTPEDEGADEDDSLTWYIDGNECNSPGPGEDTANSGGINLNFIIEAASGECELPGDYSPCGNVTLAEVVDIITVWDLCTREQCPPGESATLAEVVDLITAWDLCTKGQCPT